VAWGRGGLLLQLLRWQKLHICTTCCGSDARPGGMARGQLAVELSQILFVALWVMLFSVAVSMRRVVDLRMFRMHCTVSSVRQMQGPQACV
jgi:hypothetical protein